MKIFRCSEPVKPAPGTEHWRRSVAGQRQQRAVNALAHRRRRCRVRRDHPRVQPGRVDVLRIQEPTHAQRTISH